VSEVLKLGSGATEEQFQLSNAEAEEFRKRFQEGGPGFLFPSVPTGGTTLAAALARVQAELPSVVKAETATIPGKEGRSGYKYSYADLAAVTRAIVPLLGKHGLAWVTKPTLQDGRFVLAYRLLHEDGEAEEGVYPLNDRGTPQEIGSAITYARRYALCSVTGVAPDDDDDAAEATGAHQRGQLSTPAISAYERQLGIALLRVPTDEERSQAGPEIMTASFQQALDFRACLHEKAAWELPVDAEGHAITWSAMFEARILAEIAAVDGQQAWHQLRNTLNAADLGRAYAKPLNDRAHQLVAAMTELVNQLTANITNATTLQDAAADWAEAVAAERGGRITDVQLAQIKGVYADRRAKLEREQNQAVNA
jgi:hypothetical protein